MSPTHSNRSGGMKHRDDPQAGTKNSSGGRSFTGMDDDKQRAGASQDGRAAVGNATRQPCEGDHKNSSAPTNNERDSDRDPGTRLSAGDRDNPREDDRISRR